MHIITLFYKLLIDILYFLLKGIGVAKETDPGHIFGLGLLVGSLSFGGAYVNLLKIFDFISNI